jgi:hypothetical protein
MMYPCLRVDISGDGKATVKREDGPLAEPPGALDLSSPEVVYSADGALYSNIDTGVGKYASQLLKSNRDLC